MPDIPDNEFCNLIGKTGHGFLDEVKKPEFVQSLANAWNKLDDAQKLEAAQMPYTRKSTSIFGGKPIDETYMSLLGKAIKDNKDNKENAAIATIKEPLLGVLTEMFIHTPEAAQLPAKSYIANVPGALEAIKAAQEEQKSLDKNASVKQGDVPSPTEFDTGLSSLDPYADFDPEQWTTVKTGGVETGGVEPQNAAATDLMAGVMTGTAAPTPASPAVDAAAKASEQQKLADKMAAMMKESAKLRNAGARTEKGSTPKTRDRSDGVVGNGVVGSGMPGGGMGGRQ